MSDKKLILDADGQIARVVTYKPEDGFFGEFTIETIQNLDPLIEQNKFLREQSRPGQATKETMTLIGTVPCFIIEQADREHWDDADWDKFFNDPDNAIFKTFYGQV